MTPRNAFPLLRSFCIGIIWLAICFDGMDCKPQGDEPVRPMIGFPYPRNATLFKDCIKRNFTGQEKELSIFSTRECEQPIVELLKPNNTNFLIIDNKAKYPDDGPRNITVAFRVEKLESSETDSMLHYVFGQCDVVMYIAKDNRLHFDYQYDTHSGPWFNLPLSSNEQKMVKALAIGPEGISITQHVPKGFCWRDCKTMNPDGTINFTQVVVKGHPALKLSFITLDADTDLDGMIVDQNTKQVLTPTVEIAGSKTDQKTVKIEYAEADEKKNGTKPTMTPKPTEADKGGLEGWQIAAIVVGVVGVVLILALILGILLAFLFCKKKPAAAGGTGVSTRSVMGTVTTESQMGTTAGTTVGDEQINVVVQN